ncbi:SPOR domain-containing protein, partial [Anaeromyxobacter sp. Red801]|uniref:SPOR domain-containing protein n=1 Tax=Anaeromyxobacter sp. Red801 TaxID=3411632 RepID=UPI003BA211F1
APAKPAAAPAPAASPKPAAAPAAPVAAAPKPAAAGAFVVQLAATQSRTEAERIAAKYRALSPRIEAADVPGKGRFFRVRAGSFATRAEAERYLRDAERESGAKGFVTASR